MLRVLPYCLWFRTWPQRLYCENLNIFHHVPITIGDYMMFEYEEYYLEL
jgi:hypothetical protein